ncbi:MAG: DUF1501 domain-containing protein, partial [Planctomycetales bacterium]
QQDMRLNIPPERFSDRRYVLAELDRLNRQLENSDSVATVGKFREQAYQVLTGGGVAEALDLSTEDPKTLDLYDTEQYTVEHNWNRAARGKSGYYTGQAKTIGKLLLMARRLCEAGCGFVTIHAGYAGVWDMHADRNNPNVVDGMNAVGSSFDHAVAALVQDLEDRGLTDKIMLVATGEMGRTPKLNKNGGRDHWSRSAPLLLHGGGIRAGQVIGKSTRDGGEPATDNLTPKHLISTIMHALFNVGTLRVTPGLAPTALQLASADPIPELF